MRFASPYFLFLLLGCPALYWLERRRDLLGRGSLLYSSILRLPLTRRAWFSRHLHWARIGALALLSIAISRPQHVQGFEEITSEGIDILLALDVSGSMAAEDFKPQNRLAVAKDVIARFISQRRGDRVGLVIFAGVSLTKCPLTTDTAVLQSLLASVDIGQVEDGTAIGNALANCANRLRNSKVKSKVIILLTDGVNNRGEVSPMDAAEIANRLKIKVYTIGAGTQGVAPYPIDVPGMGRQYQMLPVQLDEDLLRNIAVRTGGRYFRATDRQSLQQIYEEIDRLERSKIESRQYQTYQELFPGFALAGMLLFGAAIVAGDTYLRRLC